MTQNKKINLSELRNKKNQILQKNYAQSNTQNGDSDRLIDLSALREKKNHLETICEQKNIDESKPDIACKGVYPALARALMFDLHSNELGLIEKNISAIEGPRTIVVVGPGTEVLPYADKLNRVVRMLNGGNLILSDYNGAICDKIPAYLAQKGFDKNFSIERVVGDYDPSQVRDTVFVETRDVKKGYVYPDNSVSAIDMTVAVHHATQYEADILEFCEEAFRVLQPGGVLHIGEGDVDMKYSERKLKKIAQDLLDSEAEAVTVSDARYQDAEPRDWYFGEGTTAANVTISNTGMVRISNVDAAKTCEYFQNLGYKQMIDVNGTVVLPLIDASIEDDFQGMIVPVREYYKGITETTLKGIDPDKKEAFLKAIEKEQSDAERGLVEFYSPPAMIMDCMGRAGFIVDEPVYTKHGPFANLIARKPKTE